MDTLNILPALDPKSRFGVIQLGYDRIDQLRTEFGALANVVAMFMGKTDLSAVKLADVVAFKMAVEDRANELLATKTGDDAPDLAERFITTAESLAFAFDSDREKAAVEMLAWAVALAQKK